MNNKKHRLYNFRWLRIRILFFFCLFMLGSTVLLSSVILDQATKAINKNAANLITANSAQIEININSYLEKVERNSALLFSDEDYYKYDASTTKLNDYDKLQIESSIKDRIVDLGIMENFSDFAIVYANNSSVGWLSNSSKTLFDGDTLYEQLASYISNEKTEDGWFSGVNDSFDRLFYVKRLNKNAVLLVSFYSRELANVFELPTDLKGMSVQLVCEDNHILYSSNKAEIGMVSSENAETIEDTYGTSTARLNGRLVNIRTCRNGWRVLCSMPTSVIMSDIDELQYYTASVTVAILIVFIIMGMVLYIQLFKPVDHYFDDLKYRAETDSLSGLYNKKSFETLVNVRMTALSENDDFSFVILDVDHFKSINDNLGHDYGDKVISRTAEFLKKHLPDGTIIGRIGGDEFAFYFDKGVITEQTAFEKIVEDYLKTLQTQFLVEFALEHQTNNISLSIGAYIAAYKGEGFMDSYKKADEVLYVSKNNGRNQYSICKGGCADEE